MNKIEIGDPKISLIHFIGTPPNPPSNNILAIIDLGANIHVAKQATTTMSPLIMPNEMTAKLPDGITMESLRIVTLQLPGIIKQAIQIHIFPKMRTSPLISLGVFCYDGCTIILDKQDVVVQENGKK